MSPCKYFDIANGFELLKCIYISCVMHLGTTTWYFMFKDTLHYWNTCSIGQGQLHILLIGVSGMDMLAMATELHILREKEKQYKSTINQLKESLKRQTENQTSKDQDPAIDVDDFVRRGEMLVRLFR